MRIIAGRFKGQHLQAVPGSSTRPTTDRVREAWASSINSLSPQGFQDAVVLDAFAGSGALGFEALSRGARSVTFIDNDRKALQTIKANRVSLGLGNDPSVLIAGFDSLAMTTSHLLLKQTEALGQFDLVFLDPPYSTKRETVFSMLCRLADEGVLAPGALISYEQRYEKPGEQRKTPAQVAVGWPDGFKMVSFKQYGNTIIEYLEFLPVDLDADDSSKTQPVAFRS